jgi:hypothetical protein
VADPARCAQPALFGDHRVHHHVGVQAALHEAMRLPGAHEADRRGSRFLFAGGIEDLAAAEIESRFGGHRTDPELQADEHRRDDLLSSGIHGARERVGLARPDNSCRDRRDGLGPSDQLLVFGVLAVSPDRRRFGSIIRIPGGFVGRC